MLFPINRKINLIPELRRASERIAWKALNGLDAAAAACYGMDLLDVLAAMPKKVAPTRSRES